MDYFSHDCKREEGNTLDVLETKYGDKGYVFFHKLLETLGNASGHYLDISKPKTLNKLLTKCKIERDQCFKMLTLMVELEDIDKELWEKHRIIWYQNFVDRLEGIYKKRGQELPSKPSFCDENPTGAKVSGTEIGAKGDGNSTSKAKQSKVKENNLSSDSFEYRITLRIKKNVEALKNIKPISETSLQSWADSIRLMQTRDKLTQEEITSYLDWALADDFWHTVIQSGQAFRKAVQKGTLQGAMERAKKKSKIGSAKASDQKSDLDKVLGGSGE